MNCFFVDSKIFYGLTFNAQRLFLHEQCVNDWRKHPLDAFALVSYLRRFVYLVTFHNEKVSIGLVIPSVLRFGVQAGIFSCRRTVPPLSVKSGSNLFLFRLPKDHKGEVFKCDLLPLEEWKSKTENERELLGADPPSGFHGAQPDHDPAGQRITPGERMAGIYTTTCFMG